MRKKGMGKKLIAMVLIISMCMQNVAVYAEDSSPENNIGKEVVLDESQNQEQIDESDASVEKETMIENDKEENSFADNQILDNQLEENQTSTVRDDDKKSMSNDVDLDNKDENLEGNGTKDKTSSLMELPV